MDIQNGEWSTAEHIESDMTLSRNTRARGAGRRAPVVDMREYRSRCEDCGIRRHCLFDRLCDADERLEASADRIHGYVRRHEFIYHQGEPFRSIFIVKSGCVMTYVATSDGTEQVVGFHLPGEFFGLDGLNTAHYTSAAFALEPTHFCGFSVAQLDPICQRNPSALRRLLTAYSSEIVRQQQAQMLRNQCETEQRLEEFLLDYSERLRRLGFGADEFKLSMSRYNIASYLGSAPETVSRKFSQLQRSGLLDVNGKRIRIRNREQWLGRHRENSTRREAGMH